MPTEAYVELAKAAVAYSVRTGAVLPEDEGKEGGGLCFHT